MGDEGADHQPIPRKELCELIQRYAQAHHVPYKEGWMEFDRQFLRRHHVGIYLMKHLYCQDNNIDMTLPAFLETTHWMDEALEVARVMVDGRAQDVVAIPAPENKGGSGDGEDNSA